MKPKTPSFILVKVLLFISLAGPLVIFATSCSTTGGASALLTPDALTSEVSQGIAIGLAVYPAAQPEVAVARDLICAEVGRSNVNPAAIVADLSSLNITNQTAKVIINAGILVYNTVFTLISTNATASAQPYLDALCSGFTEGLPPANLAARSHRKPLPPHLK